MIILLTDECNTENRWYRDQNSIDTRQQMTCDNVNAANITLYTVHVNTGGDPTSNLLKNCAGTAPAPKVARKYPDPDKAFVVTSSAKFGTVFNTIGTNFRSSHRQVRRNRPRRLKSPASAGLFR